MDERLGLSELADQYLSDSRRGKNIQLPLANLLAAVDLHKPDVANESIGESRAQPRNILTVMESGEAAQVALGREKFLAATLNNGIRFGSMIR